ncbi:ATP-binding protein [Catenibacterium mitsuokai]|uniref:ATP-binding protein n=1 Tax=Catenibacterium mitsuokai TaxID=100886 RepID=UPI003F90F464
MKEFGKKAYTHTVYINFEDNVTMEDLFSYDLDTNRLITGIELYSDQKIDPDNTLLIFDAIQEVPQALSALKYFYENAPEYHIVCAGSLLGIALHQGTSFPVGKVDIMNLYPLSYKEFLLATKQIDALKDYYFVGGTLEAVQHFVSHHSYDEVRNIQKRILLDYEHDFPRPKISKVWNSIPIQISNNTYEGKRGKGFDVAVKWLADCGLIYIVNRVRQVKPPLKIHEDFNTFQLYLLDIGLLGCIAKLDEHTLSKQYIYQQFMATEHVSIYCADDTDFLIEKEDGIIPISAQKAL